MLFVSLIILLSQALAIQADFFGFGDKPGDDIEALCAHKGIDLTTFDQLKALEQGAHSSKCSDTTKEALSELVRIIGSGMDDLCSIESIMNLKMFYSQYLDTSVISHKDDELPESLRKFAIAYGLQMSNLCKRDMIEILSERVRQLLSKEDFDQVEELISDKGPVAYMLSNFVGMDDFLTPSDLALFIEATKSSPRVEELGQGDKIFMQSSTGPYVRKLQAVCDRRFKPIYQPLVMPISSLVKKGFNYKDDALKGCLESCNVKREVDQWARIVFLCEALGSVHIVEDQIDREAAEGTGGNLVRIVTADEAAAIEGDSAAQVDGPKAPEEIESETAAGGHLEMAVYSPPEKKVLLGNEIFDKKNKELVDAVKSFKTNKSEQELFKKKLMNRGLSIIGQEIKRGNFKLLISTGFKTLIQHFKKDNQAVEPGRELFKALNDMQASKAEHPDGAVSTIDDEFEVLDSFIEKIRNVFFGILAVVGITMVIGGGIFVLIAAFG